jgi:hypothetical protein
VNDTPVPGWEIELRQSAEFEPMRLEYKDRVDEDEVSVQLIGGMAAPPPENADPDENDDGDKRFGWYVVCNGRIVLAADKTTVSGWGTDDWPQWHRQYSGFIGIVLFTAAKAAALPLTTTKRSVDLSSEIYRRARPRMREVSKRIAYTNQRKQALDEARERSGGSPRLDLSCTGTARGRSSTACRASDRTSGQHQLFRAPCKVEETGEGTRQHQHALSRGRTQIVRVHLWRYGGERVMPSFDTVNYSLRPSKRGT